MVLIETPFVLFWPLPPYTTRLSTPLSSSSLKPNTKQNTNLCVPPSSELGKATGLCPQVGQGLFLLCQVQVLAGLCHAADSPKLWRAFGVSKAMGPSWVDCWGCAGCWDVSTTSVPWGFVAPQPRLKNFSMYVLELLPGSLGSCSAYKSGKTQRQVSLHAVWLSVETQKIFFQA